MVWMILLVIFAFSALVIAHEFGHFIVAKRNGIKVHEFGIGFPPKAFGFKRGETEYTINWLPLGGFVRLEGEENESRAKDSFAVKSVWVKTKVLMAGVTMNFLIAWVLFTILCIVGMANIFPFDLPRMGAIQPIAAGPNRLVVYSVNPDSAADRAGLQNGDTMKRIDTVSPQSEEELRAATRERAGQTVAVEYERSGEVKSATVTLGADADKGILGVAAISQQKERYVWWAAPLASLALMWKTIAVSVPMFFSSIWQIFTTAKVNDGLVGPIGIAAAAPQVIKFGWDYFVALVASISLSLGILNALPIPALDGGRLAVILLRKVGVPMGDHHESWAHTIGFVALMALGIVVAISDISRIWR